jgi:hypothetical protein
VIADYGRRPGSDDCPSVRSLYLYAKCRFLGEPGKLIPDWIGREAAMDAIDLSEADDLDGLECETTRHMIREIYRCESPQEDECFLRRYPAC